MSRQAGPHGVPEPSAGFELRPQIGGNPTGGADVGLEVGRALACHRSPNTTPTKGPAYEQPRLQRRVRLQRSPRPKFTAARFRPDVDLPALTPLAPPLTLKPLLLAVTCSGPNFLVFR